ncbi:pre-piRNA 3'-exonuclease trimmer-like isoform X2 [Ostrinia nubilalis]|uniref:pre-piRNA 3'-exonuclease trimmer-like isoform X1 n=1 Tax=Ostrinia nubilalis TaxID=29057 RepID=UPI0030822A56
MSPYCNRANTIRGAMPYVNFIGEDPKSHRPNVLHIKALKDRVINVGQVASTLANFGNIDIKPYGSRTALIATSTQYTADKILKQFKNSREYRISEFSVYKHSVASRVAMWSGALLTGSLMLYFFHRKMK